jgi:replicative DNA helicase
MLTAPSHLRPCLKGDTILIDATTGWPLSLEQFAKAGDRSVLTLRDAGVIRPQLPAGSRDLPTAQLYRVTTYCGRSIEACAEQPFLTRDGWKPLSKLTAADAVAVVVEFPQLFGRGDTDTELLKLLAYLTASETTGDGMAPAIEDDVVRQDFEAAVASKNDEYTELVGGDGTAYLRVHGKGGGRSRVIAFLDLVGVHGVCASAKVVPDFVFGLRREKLRLYLNRVFTCDGRPEASSITYQCKSVHLARQVQHLLARFGINCALRGREREGVLDSVVLSIGSKQDVLRFIDEIGFLGGKAVKAESTRTLLHHVRMVDPPLDRLGPILFDEVFAIEETEAAPVYDLSIGHFHNFIANDFIVHSAGAPPIASAVDAGWQLSAGAPALQP